MNGTRLDPDEATALPSTSSRSFAEYRPAVLPVVRQQQLVGSDGSDFTLDSHTFPSDAERTAFTLLVQLHCIETQYNAIDDSSDILETWQQARVASTVAEDTGRHVSETLDRFLTNCSSSSAIETIFWTVFPLEIIDMLKEKHTPPEFLLHPIVEAVVMKCWKYGMKVESPQHRSLIERFDALSTPRVLHLIDIMGRLAFIGSLIHYLLYPPRFFITLGNEQGPREIFLTFMSAASLARRLSIHALPAALVFLAFKFTLPSVPLPGNTSFSVLHIAFLLQLILLHLPTSPSLPVAINPKHAIPLSTVLLHGATSLLMPVIFFFLPALLLATFLVSASLADTFLLVLPKHLDVPIDSRFSFFVLFITMIVLLLGALGITSAMFPTLASSSASTSKWDRYSREIGLRARRTFVEALIQYEDYRFPVPFNVLQLLVRVPCVALSLLGHPVTPYMELMERVVWRVSVGLVGAVVSGVWLWGLV
ncbi:hypothetical protein AZE42_06697 [Rhizopogon vesiculosus]|uniref:Uncharacterized protein n=1 Tax=Rhizopogon vesiculosus TaxID=180088 RepID=A0A1J8PU91_9AGAM|nr:hypothetical protein AZE42_06697 [Rhizopogon vesiculosus]